MWENVKVASKIVDMKFNILGFSFDNGKSITLMELRANNIKTAEFGFNGSGKLEFYGNFNLRDLPTYVMDRNGTFVSVSGDIELVSRYVKDGETLGFDVVLNGKQQSFTYLNVLKLAKIYKPKNFVLRTRESDGVSYLAGKGLSLTELPCKDVSGARVEANVASQTGVVGSMQMEASADILGIIDFVKSVHGHLVELRGSKYVAHSGSTAEVGDGFISLGIGAIASPHLKGSETSMNLNVNFRVPGIVQVELSDGKAYSMNVFTYKQKSVFKDGRYYMDEMGVAFNSAADGVKFLEKYGRTLAIEEIKDIQQIQPLKALVAQPNLVLYKLDVSKLEFAGKESLPKLIIDEQKLVNMVGSLHERKIVGKFLEEHAKNNRSISGTVHPNFAGLSVEDRIKVAEVGINIYDGSYTVRREKVSPSDGSAGAVVKALPIEVEYMPMSWDASKYTKSDLYNFASKVPEGIQKMLSYVQEVCCGSAKDIQDALKGTKMAQQEIVDTLALNKIALLISGNGNTIYSHINNDWELTTEKKKKGSEFYKNKKTGMLVRLQSIGI